MVHICFSSNLSTVKTSSLACSLTNEACRLQQSNSAAAQQCSQIPPVTEIPSFLLKNLFVREAQ